MLDGITSFNLTTENAYWDILQDANKLHLSSRQRYLRLLDTCQTHRVAFKDIRNYLLNQAKHCGLYRKDYWDNKRNSLSYPPKSRLNRTGWYRALNNFMSWLAKNYKDYGVTISRVKSVELPPPATKSTTVTRSKSQDGTIQEVRTEVVTQDVPSGTDKDSTSIISPISSSLSLAQTQALILQNLDVLGAIAEEKGATAEFNALMIKMGAIDHLIENEDD